MLQQRVVGNRQHMGLRIKHRLERHIKSPSHCSPAFSRTVFASHSLSLQQPAQQHLLLSSIFTIWFANLYDVAVWRSQMKNDTGWTPNVPITSCPFILPSHFLIESSQAATASHYEQLLRFKVGQALLYEIAAIDGNPMDYMWRQAWNQWAMLLQFISIHLQALGFK